MAHLPPSTPVLQYDVLALTPSKHVRIAALEDFWERTVTVGSAGKQFSATGWRVGWLVGPANLIRSALAASTRVTFTTNTPLQMAVATGIEKADENKFFESMWELDCLEARANRADAIVTT